MRASRGMGDIRPSKMPKRKMIKRTDNPDDVASYAGGDWIKDAINPKNKGSLRKALGAKPGKPIPAPKLAKAAKMPGKLGQRARLAQTLKKFK